MRIPCPFCGEREASEFICLGDAPVTRAVPEAPDALAGFVDAIYLRDNVAGLHDEHWYHASGCRSWLRVTRDTLTHQIASVAFANGGVA
jgi:methylglutamate dehydrogenase subunit B